MTRYSALELAQALGLPGPTPEQQAVIEAGPEPLLVVAGAGSGKTETMSARVVWLVANGLVSPDQVLGLTFTRKAAGELSARITGRLSQLVAVGVWTPPTDDGTGAEVLGGTPTIMTYHSYASRILRENALLVGVEPDFRMLTEAGAWQLASEAVHRYDGPMAAMSRREGAVTEAVMNLAGELAEHVVTLTELEEHLDRVIDAFTHTPAPTGRASVSAAKDALGELRQRRLLTPIVRSFLELKRSRDSVDFADQMALAARLVRDVPAIGVTERGRYRAVLLDEFQDTSEAQLVLMRELFGGSLDLQLSVTAVGDPNQSIYGWRGASSTTLTRFPSEFARNGVLGERLPLSTSWRNDRAILRVANVVAAPLAGAGVGELQPRADAGEGEVLVSRFANLTQECEAVAAWVAGQWRSPSGRRTGRTAAVLCRRRAHFPAVVDALTKAGLPVEVVGLGGLLITPEVSDLVAALTVVADPTRGDALMRLLTGPIVRLGAADLDVLWRWAREQHRRQTHRREPQSGQASTAPPDRATVDLAADSADEATLAEAIDQLPPAAWTTSDGRGLSEVAGVRLRGLAETLRWLRRQLALPLVDLVGEVERELGLDVEVLARPEHTASTARVHLDAFADVAAGYTASADRPTLAGFVSWLEAARDQERGLDAPVTQTDPDAVQVLTVHAAKGLEWDVVAVPALVESSFPNHGVHGAAWDEETQDWRLSSQPRDKGWLAGISALPWDLRGDRDGLPLVRWSGAADLAALSADIEDVAVRGGERAVAEERRLAYVALTRARRALWLSAHLWSDRKQVNVTSRFLREVLAAHDPSVRVGPWEPAPLPVTDAKGRPASPPNPFTGAPLSATWPLDPAEVRRRAVTDAAARVAEALERAPGPGEGDTANGGVGTPGAVPSRAGLEQDLALLLAEKAALSERTESIVEVPRHLSASAVVALARDPQAFAHALRRPMPGPPAVAARRGTAFHAWVEKHYARAALVDTFDLPGSADEDPGSDLDLLTQRATFLASEWADQVPVEVELAVETVLDGIAVRGRIDAVFARADGGFTVVDWKTGVPATGAAGRVRTLQLGAYALAYARLRGVPADRVDAAFFHASTGQTLRPQLPGESELVALLSTLPEP